MRARRPGSDGRRLAELDEPQVYRVMLKNARVTYDELAAAGKHGLPTPHNIGWFHEKVLAGRGWRIAPEVMLERLAALHQSRDGGAVLVPGRVLYATNSVEFPPAARKNEIPPAIHLSRQLAESTGSRMAP
jgi:hypothetical protein